MPKSVTRVKSKPFPEPPRLTLLLAGLVLLFLLLAWGVWWYFDWKIKLIESQGLP